MRLTGSFGSTLDDFIIHPRWLRESHGSPVEPSKLGIVKSLIYESSSASPEVIGNRTTEILFILTAASQKTISKFYRIAVRSLIRLTMHTHPGGLDRRTAYTHTWWGFKKFQAVWCFRADIPPNNNHIKSILFYWIFQLGRNSNCNVIRIPPPLMDTQLHRVHEFQVQLSRFAVYFIRELYVNDELCWLGDSRKFDRSGRSWCILWSLVLSP